MNALLSHLLLSNQEYPKSVQIFPKLVTLSSLHPRQWQSPLFLLSNRHKRAVAIRIFEKLPVFFCFLIIIGNEMGHYYFLGSHFTNHTTSNLFSVPDRDIPSFQQLPSVFFRMLVSLLIFFMAIFHCV